MTKYKESKIPACICGICQIFDSQRNFLSELAKQVSDNAGQFLLGK